jgi:hypothetical protein
MAKHSKDNSHAKGKPHAPGSPSKPHEPRHAGGGDAQARADLLRALPTYDAPTKGSAATERPADARHVENGDWGGTEDYGRSE